MTEWPRPAGDEVTVDDDVLISVESTHVAHVSEQVVVRDHRAAPDQLGGRGHQPQAMTDDSFEDVCVGKGAL